MRTYILEIGEGRGQLYVGYVFIHAENKRQAIQIVDRDFHIYRPHRLKEDVGDGRTVEVARWTKVENFRYIR